MEIHDNKSSVKNIEVKSQKFSKTNFGTSTNGSYCHTHLSRVARKILRKNFFVNIFQTPIKITLKA